MVAYVQMRLEGRTQSPRRKARKPRTEKVEPQTLDSTPTQVPVLPRQREPQHDTAIAPTPGA